MSEAAETARSTAGAEVPSLFGNIDTGRVALTIGTIIYGISVVLAREAMDYLGPYSFNALCHALGCCMLVLFRPQLLKFESMTYSDEDYDDEYYEKTWGANFVRSLFPAISERTENILNLLMFAIPYGILQFMANICGQIGLVSVEAGKSAFLTSLYVVFTPLLQSFVVDKSVSKINKWTWISAAVSIIGSFLLAGCDGSNFSIAVGFGEVLTVLAALFWAFEIIIADIGSKFLDGVDLAMSSSIVSSAIAVAAAFIKEPDTMYNLLDIVPTYCWKIIIWVSVMETVACVVDTIGQAYTTGYQAAIIMGMDGVVTVIVAYFYLGEQLTAVQMLGCSFLLTATYLASIEEDPEDHTLQLKGGRYDRRLAMGGWPHQLRRSNTIDHEYRRRPRYYSNLELSALNKIVPKDHVAAPVFLDNGTSVQLEDYATTLKKHHSFHAGDEQNLVLMVEEAHQTSAAGDYSYGGSSGNIAGDLSAGYGHTPGYDRLLGDEAFDDEEAAVGDSGGVEGGVGAVSSPPRYRILTALDIEELRSNTESPSPQILVGRISRATSNAMMFPPPESLNEQSRLLGGVSPYYGSEQQYYNNFNGNGNNDEGAGGGSSTPMVEEVRTPYSSLLYGDPSATINE